RRREQMKFSPHWFFALTLFAGLVLHGIWHTPTASAQEEEPVATAAAEETPENLAKEQEEAAADPVSTLAGEADILWVCLAAFLVFFMQAGFTLVECGLTR